MSLGEFIYSAEFMSLGEFIYSDEFMLSYAAGTIPYFGVQFRSLSLEQRRWQKRYRSYPGDGNVRHHCARNTYTRVWGLRSACNHVVQHDCFHSSCCLSKSKNESKSAKEIEIDSFFRTNCRRLTKRTGYCAWPCHSFS